MARLRTPVPPPPRVTAQLVYDELHGRIVRGELRPGEALSETKVADLYGISRTPVREVFWRLGEDGFLRVVPQVGTYVAPINVVAVRDAQFIRETLECRAIQDAARDPDTHALEALQGNLAGQHEAMAAHDYPAFFLLDDAMHRTLMEMSGRPFVWRVIAGAKAQLDRVRFLSLEDADWMAMILGEHREILGCVAARDPHGASRVMQAHLRTAFAAVDRLAAEHADFFEGVAPRPHGT